MQWLSQTLVEEFYFDYAARDIVRATANFHEEFRLSQHVSPDAAFASIGGTSIGKHRAQERMDHIASLFELVDHHVELVRPSVDTVRSLVRMHWRHRGSGEKVETRKRHVWTLRDGLLASVDTYDDTPMMEAYFRLIAASPEGVTAHVQTSAGA